MSWYIELGFDSAFSVSLRTELVIASLRGFAELRLGDSMQFRNANDLPWLVVQLFGTEYYGDRTSANRILSHVNNIDLICSYSFPDEWYTPLAERIARSLGWQIVEVKG